MVAVWVPSKAVNSVVHAPAAVQGVAVVMVAVLLVAAAGAA